jgi:hypothetical protein
MGGNDDAAREFVKLVPSMWVEVTPFAPQLLPRLALRQMLRAP